MSFNVNPASASFEEMKADLKAYMDSRPDAAKWKDFFDSQTGTTVIELMAGMGTMLKYDAIVARREAFSQYAQNRSSVIAHAESVGYSAFRGRNQVLKLTVVPNFTGVIQKFAIVGAIKDQDLVMLGNATCNEGVQQDIFVVMGVLKQEALSASAITPTSFRFTQPKVSQDLRVLLNTTEVQTSERVLDLINEKWVVQSNVFGSVDVMYLNLDSFLTQFISGDTINLEYVELKDTAYESTDVVFNLGALVSFEVDSIYKAPEDIESVRINAPLYNETQFVIRGRDDYEKIFRQLDPVIKSTSYKDISPAVVELYYVKDDLSFYTDDEKEEFITRLSSFRAMGLVPPLIADPEIVFLDLGIHMVLQGTAINPTNVARSAVEIYEQKLGVEVSFNDIEETLEDDDNVKIARITLRGTTWEPEYNYPRGAFVKAIPDNTLVYEMTKVLYFSGAAEPVFPMTIGQSVQDKSLVWTACALSGPCDTPDAWAPNTAYNIGDQVRPVIANGVIYCVTDFLNLSGTSTEIQHIAFGSVPTQGTWRLEFGSETTVDMPFNATAGDVATALNNLLGLSTVQVNGDYSAGFDVVFAGDDSNLPQPTLTLTNNGQNEINCIFFDLVPNMGTWKLEYAGQQTGFLAHNISNADLKTALEGLSTIGVGNVDVLNGVGGEKYRVEFKGAMAKQPLAFTLTMVTNTMTAATLVVPEIEATTEGESPNSGTNEQQKIIFSQVPTTGQWTLNYNGNTTTLLAFNAAASAVQAALEALPSVGAGNVVVSGTYSLGFTVLFQGALGAQDAPLLTNPNNTLQNGLQLVDITFQTPVPGVLPFAGTDEVQFISFPFVPDSGSFALQFGPETTALIAFSDTALSIQTALNALTGLSAVTVTGDFTNGFEITFTGADGLQNQPLLAVVSNTLGASSAPLTIDMVVCQVGKRPAQNLKDAGNFNVPITVVTTTDGSNPEPDWANAVGIADICP